MTGVQELEQFALAHYDQGGHWIVECWGSVDYECLLRENSNDVELAKEALKREWEITVAQERECAWGAPDEPADFY
jgi:hypothetical protein